MSSFGSARRRSPGRARGRPSARRGRADVGVFLVDGAGHDHRRESLGGPLADQAGERGEHRRHPAFDVAGPSAVEPAALDDRGGMGRSSSRRPAPCPGGHRKGWSVRPSRESGSGRSGWSRPGAIVTVCRSTSIPIRRTSLPGSRSSPLRGTPARSGAGPSGSRWGWRRGPRAVGSRRPRHRTPSGNSSSPRRSSPILSGRSVELASRCNPIREKFRASTSTAESDFDVIDCKKRLDSSGFRTGPRSPDTPVRLAIGFDDRAVDPRELARGSL